MRDLGKVSVIVPVFNTESLLKKCINSILSQTYSNIELILVDDGSTDNSRVVIEHYVKEYPWRISAIFQDNSGQAAARNAALNIASGDYISFVDSDDWIEKETLEKLLNNLDSTNSDISTCDFKTIDENNCITGEYSSGPIDEKGQDVIENSALPFLLVQQVTCKVFRAHLFNNNMNRFPEGIWYEDLALLPLLVCNAERISKINQPLYNYYKRNGSTTMTISLKVLDALKALSFIDEKFRDNKNYHLYIKYITSQKVRMTFLTSLRIALLDSKGERNKGFSDIKQYIKSNKVILLSRSIDNKSRIFTSVLLLLVYFGLGEAIYKVRKIKELFR